MATQQKMALRKLSLLEPATGCGNPSRAGKPVGYSHRQFHEIRQEWRKARRTRERRGLAIVLAREVC